MKVQKLSVPMKKLVINLSLKPFILFFSIILSFTNLDGFNLKSNYSSQLDFYFKNFDNYNPQSVNLVFKTFDIKKSLIVFISSRKKLKYFFRIISCFSMSLPRLNVLNFLLKIKHFSFQQALFFNLRQFFFRIANGLFQNGA